MEVASKSASCLIHSTSAKNVRHAPSYRAQDDFARGSNGLALVSRIEGDVLWNFNMTGIWNSSDRIRDTSSLMNEKAGSNPAKSSVNSDDDFRMRS